jgi:hypothetical protein
MQEKLSDSVIPFPRWHVIAVNGKPYFHAEFS